MNADQMSLPNGLSGIVFHHPKNVPGGVFAIVPAQRGRHLFFVAWLGNIQGFFPVLNNGTISRIYEPVLIGSSGPFDEVMVFLSSEIPGIQRRGGKLLLATQQ